MHRAARGHNVNLDCRRRKEARTLHGLSEPPTAGELSQPGLSGCMDLEYTIR
jgi:hypothetical protein